MAVQKKANEKQREADAAALAQAQAQAEHQERTAEPQPEPKVEPVPEKATVSPVVEPVPQTAMGQAMAQATKVASQERTTTNNTNAQQTQTQTQYQGTPSMSNSFANTAQMMFDHYNPRFQVADQGDTDAAALLKMVKEIQDKSTISGANSQGVLNFHVVPKSVTGSFTVLAVSTFQSVNNKNTIAVQSWILETSRPPLETLTQQVHGNVIEIILTPVDAFKDDLKHLVHKEVSRYYKNETNIVDAGLQVIYSQTNVRDEITVTKILNEAADAIDATLRRCDPQAQAYAFNLDKIKTDPNVSIVSKFAVNEDKHTATGLPVRSDITAKLIMQYRSAKQQVIQSNTQRELTDSAAYVDLLYTAPQSTFGAANNFPMFQQGQPQYHYVPRITITQLVSRMTGSALEFAVLGIANLTTLNRNRGYGIQWSDSYNRSTGGNLRNLGALGWQLPHLAQDNQPGLLTIESDQQLQQLIATAISPSPVYTLEIEQASSNGWLLDVFAKAAGTDGSNANAAIVNAADNLTGGRFRSIYAAKCGVSIEAAAGIPVVRETRDRNHTGFYKNPEGEYRDLRELDLLAILNIAAGNIQLVQDYLATTVTTIEEPLVRLDNRLRIFRALCSEVHVKGYTTKFDLSAAFVTALVEAIEKTGFTLNSNNTLLNSQQQVYTQTIQDWSSVMVDPNVGSGLYQQASSQLQGSIYNIGEARPFNFYG
jgi:hypothetical protein